MDLDEDFNEYNDGKDEMFDEDDDRYGDGYGPPPPLFHRKPRRNARYGDAFGNYSGGYGPGGGFMPGPMGPPGPPPPMWGQGFGPMGPPMRRPRNDDRAIAYLMRCGVPKENLRNLPRSLLNLITPNHCGLCKMSFDSFIMSRMHYISKNHLKKQKKWILQKQGGGLLRHRETPLKSRDLYCELCDVHITSKVHAESHYSGKHHRAIVEGRKNPKNPILLQRGMEARLEQLIRREKKFIKAAAEAPVEEQVEGEAKEKLNTSSEFYCDICKTSMTCSEQMTMHLNGKRHLSKEKQHILKMMKGDAAGETSNNDGNEGDGNAEPDAGANGGEGESGEKGEQGEGEQDYDWGNGSGQWETEDNNGANQGTAGDA